MAKANILIVEDEWLIADDIQNYLEINDYNVVSIVSTGEGAVRNADAQQPDLILMDIFLKGEMNGIKAARIIKDRFNIPHIYLTSYADPAMLEEAKTTEPYGYLLKPFDNKELSIAIEMALYKHQMEKELRDSHKFLQTIIDGVADPIMVINENYNVELMNLAAKKITGKREFLRCYEVSHKKDKPCHGMLRPCPLEIVKNSGEPIRLVHEHFDVNDEKIFVEILASPLYKKDGSFSGIVESSRDITERKKSEERLATYSRKLEESNKLKDLFTDIIRHDLMNPIQVISLYTNELKTNKDMAGKTKKDIQIIETNLKKVIVLLEHATYYAKLEDTGKLDFESLDICLLMESTVKELELGLGKDKSRIQLEKREGCILNCNIMIKEVLLNVISNALKYSPDDKPVMIGYEESVETLTIHIKDNGEGIHADHKKTIFNRFTRLKKEGVKGSGLGLAISKKITELHNGDIWVEDNPEGGSIFFIELSKGDTKENSFVK